MAKLPISAMIVGYNEAHFLKQCLASISFCEEIVYTDLGSTDNSLEIAKLFTHKIYHRDKNMIPSCEMVFSELVHTLKNDWVIFIDPDESLDESLADDIKARFFEYTSNEQLGAVLVPWHFYFNKHKLRGTIWGGTRTKPLLVNRERFLFKPIIHYGRMVKPEFGTFEIPLKTDDYVLHHFWMNSFSVFFKKHARYLVNEGKDQYNLGRRVGKKEVFFKPYEAFLESFVTKKGYKDFGIGFFLSIFWAYYQTRIAIDILKLQINKR